MNNLFFYILIFITSSVSAGTFTSTADGDWTNDAIWTGSPGENDCSPSGNHTFNVEDSVYVICPGGFSVTGNFTINVRPGGVLYIATDGAVSGSLDLNVESGGRVIVTGDWTSGGNSDVIVDGYFEVQGTATGSGSYDFDCDGTSGSGETVILGGSCAFCTSGTTGCTNTLPVSYGSFDLALHEDGVELTWTTVTEENNDFFTIQRSYDGITWEDIEELEGAGNSSEPNFYLFVDTNPFYGVNYYRIKQTDYDGTESVSEIKTISTEEALEFKMDVHPNPGAVGEPVHLKFDGVYSGHIIQFSIFDVSGKIVHTQIHEIEEYHGVHVGVELNHQLSSGSYVVKAINGSQVSNHKLIIQ